MCCKSSGDILYYIDARLEERNEEEEEEERRFIGVWRDFVGPNVNSMTGR